MTTFLTSRVLAPLALPSARRTTLRLAAAALVGAGVAWVAAAGPQPLTDRLVPPVASDRVVVVGMDGADEEGWRDSVQACRLAGADTLVAIGGPAGLDALAPHPERSLDVDLGFRRDLDGEVRSWSSDSLVGRTLASAGESPTRGLRRLAFRGEPLPALGHTHLPYLQRGALDDRIVVLARREAWEVPMVPTPAGELTAVQATARAIAGPSHGLPGWRLLLVLGALLGLAGGVAVERRRLRTLIGGLTLVLGLSPVVFALGLLFPVEAGLAALLGGLLASFSLAVASHRDAFRELVDEALWTLRARGHAPRSIEDWELLTLSAVDLGVGVRAWAMEEVGGRWRVRAAADAEGLVHAPDPEPPASFARPLHLDLDRGATLLVQSRPFPPPGALDALDNLRRVVLERAAGQASLPDERSYFVTGAAIVKACFEALRRSEQVLAASVEVSAHPRALFDPLGRPLRCDERMEALLSPSGLPRRLSESWEALGGQRSDLALTLAGGPAQSLRLADGRLLVLRSASKGGQVMGLVVEALPTGGGLTALPAASEPIGREQASK